MNNGKDQKTRLDPTWRQVSRLAVLLLILATAGLCTWIAVTNWNVEIDGTCDVASGGMSGGDTNLQISLFDEFCARNPFFWALIFSIVIPSSFLLIGGFNSICHGRLFSSARNSASAEEKEQDRGRDYVASIYQKLELPLVKNRIIRPEAMMAYHAQYSWGAHAATAMAAVLVLVSVLSMQITFILGGMMFALFVFTNRVRSIPFQEVEQHFDLENQALENYRRDEGRRRSRFEAPESENQGQGPA